MIKTSIFLAAIATLLTACNGPAQTTETEKAVEAQAVAETAATRLAAVLAAQPDETRARYVYRHPAETLAFFGVQPGMTVVEALPGRGWYSKLLVDYLGPDGHLIGADYPIEIFPLFGFFSEEFIASKKTWVQDWTAEAGEWRDEDDARVSAFVFGSMPGEFAGSADVVLFIRALHNLNRFEGDGGFMTASLADARRALKAGGILGVVQHQAPDSLPDQWADGSKGYLKKAALIATLENAGFEFVGATDINANPNDQPTEEDIVWRLPPTLATSREDPELRAQMEAIGESNRMTLKFRKR